MPAGPDPCRRCEATFLYFPFFDSKRAFSWYLQIFSILIISIDIFLYNTAHRLATDLIGGPCHTNYQYITLYQGHPPYQIIIEYLDQKPGHPPRIRKLGSIRTLDRLFIEQSFYSLVNHCFLVPPKTIIIFVLFTHFSNNLVWNLYNLKYFKGTRKKYSY